MLAVGQRVRCKSAVWDESKWSHINADYTVAVIEYVHPKGRYITARLTFGTMSYLESFRPYEVTISK